MSIFDFFYYFSWVITDRIRRMREGNVFSLSTPGGGGGTPTRSRRGGGAPSSLGWGAGTLARSRLGGVPHPALEGGVPQPGPDRGGTPARSRWGVQKEYSLRGGRYASCVHAGGLSSYNAKFKGIKGLSVSVCSHLARFSCSRSLLLLVNKSEYRDVEF